MITPVDSRHPRPAVALVTAHGWVGVSTPVIMTAKFLAQKGYLVDIFLEENASCDRLGIAIPEFNDEKIQLFAHKIGEVPRHCASRFRDLAIPARDMGFVSRFKHPPKRYDFAVGFDPDGLIRAGLLSFYWEIPFIYHSLEISDQKSEVKERERWFSQRALLTLMQDDDRARTISKYNGIHPEKIRIVFNNSIGEPLTEKKTFFREKFNIPEDKTIILATGTLLPITCIDKILRAADTWPSNFVLVLHGWIPDIKFEAFVRSSVASSKNKVYLSTDIVNLEEKFTVFQSADIGLAFYEPIDINLELAAGSSGKIFDFMRCGVPIIGNDIPGMEALIEGNRCGLVVRDPGGVGLCLTDIQKNYQFYRQNCFKAFYKYDFCNCYEGVLQEIRAFQDGGKRARIRKPDILMKSGQATEAAACSVHHYCTIRNGVDAPEDSVETSRNRWPEGEVFIASFPRSGNTWLRLLLSDMILQMHGIKTDTEMVLDLSDRIIPDMHCHDTMDIDQRIRLPFRLIKTHNTYFSVIRKTIFLFRSPADALCSYYHYQRGHDKLSPELLDDKNAFVLKHTDVWADHTKSFLQAYAKGLPILFVSYESLHENPLAALQRIFTFLNLPAEDSTYRFAIENHTFVHHKDRWIFGTKHREHFFRKGKIGSSLEELHAKVLEKIVENTGAIYEVGRDIGAYQAYSAAAVAAGQDVSVSSFAGFLKHVEQEIESFKRGNTHASLRGQEPFRVPQKDAEMRIQRTLLLATLAYNVKDFGHCLRLASIGKSLKHPAEGLDYLRALSFLGLGEKGSAHEALKEELRLFPGNRPAQNLLDRTEPLAAVISTGAGHSEVDQMLKIIRPYTMVGDRRLRSLYALVRKVCELDIPGNIVECGVAAGGSSALIAAVVKRYSLRPRTVFCFDTFEGMPEPTEYDTHYDIKANDTGWGTGTCAAPLESLLEVCSKLDVRGMVTPIKGLFKDTLPEARSQIESISLLHMDGDWYESTRDILFNLFDLVIPGGIIQVDDYGYWQGCKKVLHEFFEQKGIRPVLTDIDGTGVWFSKGAEPPPLHQPEANRRRINLGCGKHAHPGWVNVDFRASDPSVIAHDLRKGIPFDNESFDTVYHSHLLEHLPKSSASEFLRECFRILKPGGHIRVVVPDLEQIARLYIESLDGSLSGERDAQKRYEWITLELLDQMVRNYPGGEILNYWKMDPMPAEEFVIQRVGSEVRTVLEGLRKYRDTGKTAGSTKNDFSDFRQIGAFRLSGEIHQWMYDRYSLRKMLNEAGFEEIMACRANESRIPDFNSYLLDMEPDGSIRKPDSLFMEGTKPVSSALLTAAGGQDIESSLPTPARKPHARISKSSFKIVHLSTLDSGGAGIASWRLHKGLQRIGVDSTMLVLGKQRQDSSVRVLPEDYSISPASCLDVPAHDPSLYWRKREMWNRWLSRHAKRPQGLEIFSGTESEVGLESVPEFRKAEIVHLHWVSGLLDFPRLPEMMAGKHIVWTLHDMNPFTGGCHYAGDCSNYSGQCGNCPQLGSEMEVDLSRRIWTIKHHAYLDSHLNVVTPSRWLGECASQSSLMSSFPRSTIPNGLPVDIFKPLPKAESRRAFRIPEASRVVLFGAASVMNRRKGIHYLLEALSRLRHETRQSITFLVFGQLPNDVRIETPWPVVCTGSIEDEKKLAGAYSAADVFVIPSLEDNLPNTVLEALACGIPVVGFDAGGIPDMVRHQETGYLAETKNTEALARGISWVLNSSMDFQKACRDRAVQEYSLEARAKEYAKLYDRLFEKGKTEGKARTQALKPSQEAPLPKVSALVSAYNSASLLKGCLSDLVAQSIYRKGELEIIVIDSGSQQHEREVVEKFQKEHPGILYIRTKERETLYAAWNRGIEAARGAYLTNANTDDRHHPEALEVMATELDRDASIDLVYGLCKECRRADQTFGECPEGVVYCYPEYFPPRALLHYQFGPQPMWRKSVHDKIGLFDPSYRYVGDFDFNIRFALHGLRARRINQVLGSFYLNPDSLTNSNPDQPQEKKDLLERYRGEENILRLYQNSGWLVGTPREKAAVLNDFGVMALLFDLPWSSRKESCLSLSLIAFKQGLHYAPDSKAIRDNIAILEEVIDNRRPFNIGHFKRQMDMDGTLGDAKKSPVEISAGNGKRISFFAGDADNFQFATPIMDYLRGLGFRVHFHPSRGMTAQKMDRILADSDFAWFEWGNGPIVHASRAPKRCPIVCRIHRYEVFGEDVKRINWRNVDALVFVSQAFSNLFREKLDPEIDQKTLLKVIPNPIDEKMPFRKRINNHQIAHISRFHPDKNPALMLQILAKLVALDPRFKVSMIGRIQDDQLFRYCMEVVRKCGLENHFSYDGTIQDVRGWLDDKSFILSTSIVESQGLAVMEAMMMGIKPVIHGGYGALESVYDPRYIFHTVDQAVAMFQDPAFHSAEYRDLILKRYGSTWILPRIADLMNLIMQQSPNGERVRKNGDHKEPSRSESTDSVRNISPCLPQPQDFRIGIQGDPRFSIIIPAYNRGCYLRDALQSALSQTPSDFEVLVVDDGSTDGSASLMAEFSGPVRYVRKAHTGAPDTRNLGIQQASGKYILWLDSDDVLLEDTLGRYSDLVEKNPEVDVVYGDLIVTNRDLVGRERVFYPDWEGKNESLVEQLVMCNRIPNPGTMVKKECYEKYGLYNPAFPRAHDYEFWSRTALALRFKHCGGIVVKWRWHDKNMSSGSVSFDTRYEAKVVEGMLDRFPLKKLFPKLDWENGDPGRAQSAAFLYVAKRFLILKQKHLAMKYLRKSYALYPNEGLLSLMSELRALGPARPQRAIRMAEPERACAI